MGLQAAEGHPSSKSAHLALMEPPPLPCCWERCCRLPACVLRLLLSGSPSKLELLVPGPRLPGCHE
jgi:hypothetical protein